MQEHVSQLSKFDKFMNIESMDKGSGGEPSEDFHSLNVKQMLFIDEFLFLLGSDSTD